MASDDHDGDAEGAAPGPPAGALPPIVAALWRRHEPPKRGPRRATSLDEVVRTGVAIADEEGLGAVSMARVAQRLGLTTMSLYRYVGSKDELLVLMYDEACGDAPPVDVGAGWREALRRWTQESVAALRSHPWMMDVPILGPPVGPRQISWVEAGLRALAPTPLPEDEKAGIVMILAGYTLQWVRLSAQLHSAPDPTSATDGGYGGALAQLLDPEAHSALITALMAGAFGPDPEDADLDEDFAYGLDLFLDGIEAQVAAHAGAGGHAGPGAPGGRPG
jgi:AcrR family transcriptional regulator